MKSLKKIYCDVCTLCRPFDDQDMMRIRLETDAFYLILQAIQNRTYEMIISPVHIAEINAIEDVKERYEVLVLLKKVSSSPQYNLPRIRERAEYFYNKKLGVADATHLAFAEAAADFFISCDDKLIRKCKNLDIILTVMNPVQFTVKEDLK